MAGWSETEGIMVLRVYVCVCVWRGVVETTAECLSDI